MSTDTPSPEDYPYYEDVEPEVQCPEFTVVDEDIESDDPIEDMEFSRLLRSSAPRRRTVIVSPLPFPLTEEMSSDGDPAPYFDRRFQQNLLANILRDPVLVKELQLGGGDST